MACLWGVFSVNYARLEARHYPKDLLEIPLRVALNLAYELLLEAHQFDSEGWDRTYAPIFHPDHGRDQLSALVGGQHVLEKALENADNNGPMGII